MKSRYLYGLTAIALGLSLSSAVAKPEFAVKHKLTCSYCHTMPPILNEAGEKFLDSGLKLTAPEKPARVPDRAKTPKSGKAG